MLILAKLNCDDYQSMLNYRKEEKEYKQEKRITVIWTSSLTASWKIVHKVMRPHFTDETHLHQEVHW